MSEVFTETGVEIGWTTETHLVGNLRDGTDLPLQEFKGFFQPVLLDHLVGSFAGKAMQPSIQLSSADPNIMGQFLNSVAGV